MEMRPANQIARERFIKCVSGEHEWLEGRKFCQYCGSSKKLTNIAEYERLEKEVEKIKQKFHVTKNALDIISQEFGKPLSQSHIINFSREIIRQAREFLDHIENKK